jgi:flagellar motor switch protein FliG
VPETAKTPAKFLVACDGDQSTRRLHMFENKELEKLTTAVQELVAVNKALLRKIEAQDVKLVALANFVSKNSGDMPCIG